MAAGETGLHVGTSDGTWIPLGDWSLREAGDASLEVGVPTNV